MSEMITNYKQFCEMYDQNRVRLDPTGGTKRAKDAGWKVGKLSAKKDILAAIRQDSAKWEMAFKFFGYDFWKD